VYIHAEVVESIAAAEMVWMHRR